MKSDRKMHRVLDAVDNVLGGIEKLICGTLLVVMSLVIFLQIICRFFRIPLVWSEELSRFMFIWLIYISVCISTRRESHLCVDILPMVVKGRGKIIVKIISNVLCLCFFAFVVYYGVDVIQKLLTRTQRSAGMHLNMVWPYLGPYTGAAIASLHYIILIIREIDELICFGKKEGGSEA